MQEDNEDSENLSDLKRERIKLRHDDFEDTEEMQDEEEKDDEKYLDIEEAKGKLEVWIKEGRTVRWIRRKFKNFLYNFKDENKVKVYENKIKDMCQKNKQSLEIVFDHLPDTLRLWVATEPSIIIPYLNQIAIEVAKRYFQSYEDIQPEIYVRIQDLPILDELRKLRKKELGKLIKIQGVITRRSQVFSQLTKAYYICNSCGERKGPVFQQNNEHFQGTCAACQKKTLSLDYQESIYRNFQKIIVQETPGTVPAGRVPRHKEVHLLGDNIDVARPGDEVEITGIYRQQYEYALNINHGFPVFSTIIEANYIKRVHQTETTDVNEQEIQEILNLSKKNNLSRMIYNSIAPSIYSHDHIKTAISLSLFGGVHKDIQGKHKIRGDINVLLLGDPGTAKSQFLKSVEKTFPRCVYTTGKGASAVGLTASVKKDPNSKEWSLEGGALVLADKGVCLIDEFDKMNEYDRTSIHEAMEQQTISISKAGIVANLQARCSVIAAANPIKGRYDSQLSFQDNVDLTDPILSRFDVLCVVKDEVDQDLDSKMATFVINSHIKSHPTLIKAKEDSNLDAETLNEQEKVITEALLDDSNIKQNNSEIIDQKLLRKYIMYARRFIQPKLNDIDKDKIVKFYQEIRQESYVSGGMNVATRHLESLIRLSEAHAKMHLREYVRSDDIDAAIKVILNSFIQSQKFSMANIIRVKFAKYLNSMQDQNTMLYRIVNNLIKEKLLLYRAASKSVVNEIKVDLSEFERKAKQYKIYELNDFFNSQVFISNFALRGTHIVQEIQNLGI